MDFRNVYILSIKQFVKNKTLRSLALADDIGVLQNTFL